ncbi:hypothetical protein MMC17_008493 [Xylographa soralifera]|nr:hypothetical protein [Xylographa soralifera]
MSLEMVLGDGKDSSDVQEVFMQAKDLPFQDYSDETYANILLSINKDDAEYASAVFQWVACCRHTISVEQLADALLVDRNLDLPVLDKTRRRSPKQISTLCSGLIEIADGEHRRCDAFFNLKSPRSIFQFSHPSAKDYLLSTQIQAAPARAYSIQIEAANTLILNTCLAYLLTFTESNFDLKETLKNFPLAHYAALFWVEYITPNPAPTTAILLTKLFQETNGSAYRNWLHLMYHHSNSYITCGRVVSILSGSSNEGYTCYAPPLVWASGLGLTSVVCQLLDDPSVNVNEPGVANISALAVSTHQQHHEIMELLLSHGGDVSNSFEEEDSKLYETFRAPLYDAAHWAHSKALEILLRDRSRYGKPGWVLEVVLEHAAHSRYSRGVDCVRQLIDAGVNVNARSRVSGHKDDDRTSCALDAACQRGNTRSDTVRLLLDAGADPNLHIGQYGFPLHTAAYCRGSDVVQMLLDAGADPNARSEPYGTALIAASFPDCAETVSILLAAGADTTVQWNLHGVLHELNFQNIQSDEKHQVRNRRREQSQQPYNEDIARELETIILTTRARRPPDDDIFGGEWELWRRAKSRAANISAGDEMTKRVSLVTYFRTLMDIRGAGRRIAGNLKMAGITATKEDRYMFNAMQVAVAMERQEAVDVLRESGMDMPQVVESRETEEEAQNELAGERMARLLRVRDSYQYEERIKERRSIHRGSAMMPMY